MFESDELIDRVATQLRAPVPARPEAKARLMEAVRESAAGTTRSQRIWVWLRRPRPFMISPLGTGALAGAAAALIVLAGTQRTGRGDTAPMVQPAAAIRAASTGGALAQQEVEFVFLAPGASAVTLVGDFNDWDPAATPLRQSTEGVWMIVMPLAPGRHVYSFVVDGREWVSDPRAPRAPDDDFGTPSSVIMVGGQST